MPRPAANLAALRSLVAAWSPVDRRFSGGQPTGIESLDTALGGGLPAGQLTEFVVESGGQFVLARLLETTRSSRQRVALIDASDTFAPECVGPELLRHLVWARCRAPAEALAVADILIRDGNYAAVMLDLRDAAVPALNRIPGTSWHRLHRVAERQSAAILVLSRHGAVPAVRFRLLVSLDLSLAGLRRAHAELLQNLSVETLRGFCAAERTA